MAVRYKSSEIFFIIIPLNCPDLDNEIIQLDGSRKKGRRRLDSIRFCVDATIQRLEKYIKKNKERLITKKGTRGTDDL